MRETSSPTFTLTPLAQPVRSVLLYVAMEAEASGIATALALSAPRSLRASSTAMLRDGEHNGLRIQLVTAGRDALLGVDHIGPVFGALAVARALDTCPADVIINAGTAGGFQSRGGAIGALVIARDVQFHDCRVELPNFDALARAHTRLSLSDAELDAIATLLHASVGGVSTGSSLGATSNEIAFFTREKTLAKEMELAAVAVVARERGVPLLALKSITDLVDQHEPAHEAFVKNLAFASARLARAMPQLLQWLRARG
ncbi:MAG: hypothetical protein EXS10_07950 [Phycisphaerales bacterium]|nr:hypothetical protein [Phycisphaerales bacterium]